MLCASFGRTQRGSGFRFYGTFHKSSRYGPCIFIIILYCLGWRLGVKRWNHRVILRWTRVSEFCKAHLIPDNASQKGLLLKRSRAFYSLVSPLSFTHSFFRRSYVIFLFPEKCFFTLYITIHYRTTKRYVVFLPVSVGRITKKNKKKIENKVIIRPLFFQLFCGKKALFR